MTQQGPKLCPHKANPNACPLCYQMNLRKKAAQPPPQRTSLDPQISKGPVVNVAANPVAQRLIEKKAAALAAVDAKFATNPAIQAAMAAPLPPMPQAEEANPHAQPRRPPSRSRSGAARVDGPPEGVGDNAGVYIDDGEIDALERMYPKHDSIIDRQPTHPEGHVSGPGVIRGGGGRAPVTKGRRPG